MSAKVIDRICPCCCFRGRWYQHTFCPNCRYWKALGKPCDHSKEAFEECFRRNPPVKLVRCQQEGDLVVEYYSDGSKKLRKWNA